MRFYPRKEEFALLVSLADMVSRHMVNNQHAVQYATALD
jgi:hypothetical protein